jgi:hypothetical protein
MRVSQCPEVSFHFSESFAEAAPKKEYSYKIQKTKSKRSKMVHYQLNQSINQWMDG